MTRFFPRFISSFSVLLICAACGGSTATDDAGANDTTLEATLSSIQENIFTPSCASSGCHSNTSASAGLSLAEGESFDALVGVASTEAATLNRVTAGDPDASYLIHKLEGTQVGVGGSGSRMPASGSFLSDEEVQVIRDWITAGAENN